jgi:hypothetical protein
MRGPTSPAGDLGLKRASGDCIPDFADVLLRWISPRIFEGNWLRSLIAWARIKPFAANARSCLSRRRKPLDAPREEFVPLPDVTGLRDQSSSLRGLIISHGHQDHWGLIDQVSKGVPVSGLQT